LLPTDGPRANPSARGFGDGHDLGPRQHTCTRRRELVAEVTEPLHSNGPWKDNLSDIYHDPALTAAVETRLREHALPSAG
jgi:hypothetical protein